MAEDDLSPQIVSHYKRLTGGLTRTLVSPLVRIGISANTLTLLAFISGLASLWFLFTDHLLFIAYGVLHLFLDILDGAVAREVGTTKKGEILDYFSDRGIALIALIKAYVVLLDVAFLAVIALFIIHQGVHLLHKRKGPVLYIRSTLLITLFLGFFVESSLIVGTLLGYGIIHQIMRKL